MTKIQVLVVHGGEVHTSNKSFYEMLKLWTVDPYEETKKSWKDNLQEDLGENYEVFKPQFPNKLNADYFAWKIWFEKYVEYLSSEKIILIGHSLGGIFLAKYLSENKFPKSISQLHLIAPVFSHGNEKHLDTFTFDSLNLDRVSEQCKSIFLYHSKDDNAVPFNHSREYKKKLEKAIFLEYEDQGHFFSQSNFPDLVERIKNN